MKKLAKIIIFYLTIISFSSNANAFNINEIDIDSKQEFQLANNNNAPAKQIEEFKDNAQDSIDDTSESFEQTIKDIIGDDLYNNIKHYFNKFADWVMDLTS